MSTTHGRRSVWGLEPESRAARPVQVWACRARARTRPACAHGSSSAARAMSAGQWGRGGVARGVAKSEARVWAVRLGCRRARAEAQIAGLGGAARTSRQRSVHDPTRRHRSYIAEKTCFRRGLSACILAHRDIFSGKRRTSLLHLAGRCKESIEYNRICVVSWHTAASACSA